MHACMKMGSLQGACVALAVLLSCDSIFVDAIPGGDCAVRSSNSGFSSGRFILTNTDDIDNLVADCTSLQGSLEILCDTSLSRDITKDITDSDLNALQFVELITGYVRIQDCGSLTNLNGLRSLKTIRGDELYTDPTGIQGYALHIINNDNLLSLEGLHNLEDIQGGGTTGHARILMNDNDQLCYADKIDWENILGENHWRLNRAINLGVNGVCDAKKCHVDCSCDEQCFGSSVSTCQGDCDDDSDMIIIIIVVVVFIVLLCLAILLWFYVTDRCGCRCRCGDKASQVGVLRDDGIRAPRNKVAPISFAQSAMTPQVAKREVSKPDFGGRSSMKAPSNDRVTAFDTRDPFAGAAFGKPDIVPVARPNGQPSSGAPQASLPGTAQPNMPIPSFGQSSGFGSRNSGAPGGAPLPSRLPN